MVLPTTLPRVLRVLRATAPLPRTLGPLSIPREGKTVLLPLDPSQVFKPAFSARAPFMRSLILVDYFSIGSESRGEENCDSITPSDSRCRGEIREAKCQA